MKTQRTVNEPLQKEEVEGYKKRYGKMNSQRNSLLMNMTTKRNDLKKNWGTRMGRKRNSRSKDSTEKIK